MSEQPTRRLELIRAEQKLAADTAAYLAAGGTIEQIPFGVSALEDGLTKEHARALDVRRQNARKLHASKFTGRANQ